VNLVLKDILLILLYRIIVLDHVEAKRLVKNSPNEGENLLGRILIR